MTLPLMSAEAVSFSYGGEKSFSLKDINFNIEEGRFYSVIGRNGSGKSTLVKILAGIFSVYAGTVKFRDRQLNSYGRKELAGHLAYVQQENSIFDLNISVRDFLGFGRYQESRLFGFSAGSADRAVIESALKLLSIEELGGKKLNLLSGGEKQKIFIALALVQLDCTKDMSGKMLFVDEPLTFLDVHYQFEIFNVLRALNREKRLTVAAVTHDLNAAIKYTDRSVLLENGEIKISGETTDIITEETLKNYFMINSQITNFENRFHINYIPAIK
jgi:iron complex transport system ATP-binding protein